LISNLKKLLRKYCQHNREYFEIDSELEITLSLIESGCLATLINNRTIFIYKGAQEIIDSIGDINEISFDLNCIKRQEFPSVVMQFYLINKNNKTYKFEYFFGIESEQDMKLLECLKDQDHFNIYFMDSNLQFSKRIPISEIDKDSIKSVTLEARN